MDHCGGMLIMGEVMYVCLGEWVWEHYTSCSICYEPKTTLKNKVY